MKTIKLKIATPEKVILEKEVLQITFPTKNKGELTVLPDHIPFLTILGIGLIEVKEKDKIVPMAVSGGFFEMHKNKVTILADTAERAEEIDVKRAEESRRRAEKKMREKQKTLDESQYATIVGQLEKQLARIRVVKKYRPKK